MVRCLFLLICSSVGRRRCSCGLEYWVVRCKLLSTATVHRRSALPSATVCLMLDSTFSSFFLYVTQFILLVAATTSAALTTVIATIVTLTLLLLLLLRPPLPAFIVMLILLIFVVSWPVTSKQQIIVDSWVTKLMFGPPHFHLQCHWQLHCVSKKTSSTFLTVTLKTIVRFW